MGRLINFFSSRYSKRDTWLFFLTCAFPLHFWTILLILRDAGWIAERTNVWDVVGVASYGMVFAFVETGIVFSVFLVLGLFTPLRWESRKRIAFLSLLLSAWGIVSQSLFLLNIHLPSSALEALARSGHPVRIMYAASFAVVMPTISLPALLFIHTESLQARVQDFCERLSLLSLFYLFLDLVGLVIVVLRNV